MNKNLLIGIIVLVVVLLGGAFLLRNNASQQIDTTMMEQQQIPGNVDDSATTGADLDDAMDDDDDEDEDAGERVMDAGVKTFELGASNFSFSQKEIRVKQGDTVRIVLTNENGMHDWVIDEFNARTKQIGAGQSDTVEFVADKKGTFEYYCSVGQHRANGMVGKLIVE